MVLWVAVIVNFVVDRFGKIRNIGLVDGLESRLVHVVGWI